MSLFDISPEYIHKLDQRAAAVGDVLDVCIDSYRANIENFGHDQAMLLNAQMFFNQMEADRYIIADLLTVAVDRLSRES